MTFAGEVDTSTITRFNMKNLGNQVDIFVLFHFVVCVMCVCVRILMGAKLKCYTLDLLLILKVTI